MLRPPLLVPTSQATARNVNQICLTGSRRPHRAFENSRLHCYPLLRKKLLKGKAANSPLAQYKQSSTASAPKLTDGFSPKRDTPSKSPLSAHKSRASSERRKSNKGAEQSNVSHQSAQLQPNVSPPEESESADDAGGEGTITPVKPGPNRKQARAAKAAAKAAASATATEEAVQPATAADTPPGGGERSKPKGKKAQPKEKKEAKPQQVRNPCTHASVICLFALINIFIHTSDSHIRQTHTSDKLNECYDVMYERPDYPSGGSSRITSYDLSTAPLRVAGEVARTAAHHPVHCREHQMFQCIVADVTMHTFTVVRRVAVDEGCTYSLGSSCNQTRVTSFVRRVAHQDRPLIRDILHYNTSTDIITYYCSQYFNTNFSSAANGQVYTVPPKQHILGIMVTAITSSENYTFTDFTVAGSEKGPKNTIIMPGEVADEITGLITQSTDNRLSYVDEATDATKETVLLKVELFIAKKGSGAPGPKPKRPWLSIAVDTASLTHPELIRSVNQTLGSLGFSKLKTTQKKSNQFKVKLDLLHSEYNEHTDSKGNLTDMTTYDWNSLSVYGDGIKFHLGTETHKAYLRLFSGIGSLNLKRGCFHPINRACTCNASPRQFFRPQGRDSTAEAMKKAIERARMLNACKLYRHPAHLARGTTTQNPRHHTHMSGTRHTYTCARQSAIPKNQPPVEWDTTTQTPTQHFIRGIRPRPRLILKHNKTWTFRFRDTWDHTMGYDGEGPPNLMILSQNLRGTLTGTTWEDAVRACHYRKTHIACFQEINLKRGDPRIQRLESVAKREGFTAHFTFTHANAAVGGTATLVADSMKCSHTHFRTACKGSCGVLTLTIPELNTPSNKIRVVNIYGSQHSGERTAQFKTLSRHVSKWTALVGDFNVVLSAALDVRRTATTPPYLP